MKKSEMLKKAVYYYNLQQKELNEHGDTSKRRDLIGEMIGMLNIYEINGGKRLSLDIYKPLVELKHEYYEELIFTPTIEDLDEMRYWLY